MKKRLLISAYSCSPFHSSEPGIGWNFVIHLARYFDISLIISDVYTGFNANAVIPENIEVHYYRVNIPDKLQNHPNIFMGQYTYNKWQRTLFKYIKAEKIEYDYLYHITFGRFSSPSSLCKLDAPLVFGPVGGGETVPNGFYIHSGLKNRLVEKMRLMSIFLARFGNAAKCIRKAKLVISTTEQTKTHVTKIRKSDDSIVRQAIGLSVDELDALNGNGVDKKFRKEGVFRIVAVGRLIYWKGFDLIVEAMKAKSLEGKKIEVTIIGEGPFKTKLEVVAGDLIENGAIKLAGNIPREDVFEKYREADCFCLPSLHDSGGFVHLEAIASGLPVICLDTGGPSVIIDEHCGIKVQVTDRATVINDLSLAIERLYNDPDLCIEMSKEGMVRARKFEWSAKIDEIVLRMREVGISPD